MYSIGHGTEVVDLSSHIVRLYPVFFPIQCWLHFAGVHATPLHTVRGITPREAAVPDTLGPDATSVSTSFH